MSKLVFASTISEIQQSDVFMTVKARICEAPEANLNGARVTEAFIDEIVGNEKYVGLPLYADVKALTSGNYNRLGHLYDVRTGEFHSTQIGSFYRFDKQVKGENCYLVGYARIPKRNKKLSKAISELFTDGALKFSFELSVGEYEELDDDTILIDASENNYLEGTAIVTYPACEDAVALELVAQKNTDETRKGESEMAEVETKAEVVETEATQQPKLAEEVKTEEVASVETVEETIAETTEETTETAESEEQEETEEVDACKKKENAEEETAAVITREYHEESHTQMAYDTETGKEVRQTVSITTETCDCEEGTLVETADGVHVAETEIAEDGDGSGESGTNGNENPGSTEQNGGGAGGSGNANTVTEQEGSGDAVEDPPVVHVEDQKKTAEQMIAEMLDMISELKSEIAQLKEQKQVAEAKSVVGELNPFMDTLTTEGTKYSLLEKDEKASGYSLLSK